MSPPPAPTVGRVSVVMSADDADAARPCVGTTDAGKLQCGNPADPGEPPGGDPANPGQPPGRDPADRREPRGGDRADLSELAGFRTRIAAAARRVADVARREADADRNASGGCAHASMSASYRPPPRIRELVIARDQTCRNPRCGQPAWKGDLDHTRPYHLGGVTCGCNLGGVCRGDHQLKQLPGWTLTQPEPGVFRWTTPAGRTYTTRPDQHNVG